MPRPPSDDPSDDRPPSRGVSPVGEAFTWVSRITGVGLGMTLPAVAGSWLDARLGTRFLAPAGLVFGFVAALAWIVSLGRSAPRRGGRRPDRWSTSDREPPR